MGSKIMAAVRQNLSRMDKAPVINPIFFHDLDIPLYNTHSSADLAAQKSSVLRTPRLFSRADNEALNRMWIARRRDSPTSRNGFEGDEHDFECANSSNDPASNTIAVGASRLYRVSLHDTR